MPWARSSARLRPVGHQRVAWNATIHSCIMCPFPSAHPFLASPPMASTLDVFVDFLALSDGRDKMAKIFQYMAKLLLHYARAKKAGFVPNPRAQNESRRDMISYPCKMFIMNLTSAHIYSLAWQPCLKSVAKSLSASRKAIRIFRCAEFANEVISADFLPAEGRFLAVVNLVRIQS